MIENTELKDGIDLPTYDAADYLRSKESLVNFLNEFLSEDSNLMLAEALLVAARAAARSDFDGGGDAKLTAAGAP